MAFPSKLDLHTEIARRWTEATRYEHTRSGTELESSLTNAEWVLIEPLRPPPSRMG